MVVAVLPAALKTPLNVLRLRQVARWAAGTVVGNRLQKGQEVGNRGDVGSGWVTGGCLG